MKSRKHARFDQRRAAVGHRFERGNAEGFTPLGDRRIDEEGGAKIELVELHGIEDRPDPRHVIAERLREALKFRFVVLAAAAGADRGRPDDDQSPIAQRCAGQADEGFDEEMQPLLRMNPADVEDFVAPRGFISRRIGQAAHHRIGDASHAPLKRGGLGEDCVHDRPGHGLHPRGVAIEAHLSAGITGDVDVKLPAVTGFHESGEPEGIGHEHIGGGQPSGDAEGIEKVVEFEREQRAR